MWVLVSYSVVCNDQLASVQSTSMNMDGRMTLPGQRRPTRFCWKETPDCSSVGMPGLRSQPGGSPAEEAPRSSEDEWHESEKQDSPDMTAVLDKTRCHKDRERALWLLRFRWRFGDHLHVGAVGHPAGQLLRCKTPDLQLVGVSPARFPFGREMEESRSRVHVELQTKEQEHRLDRVRL